MTSRRTSATGARFVLAIVVAAAASGVRAQDLRLAPNGLGIDLALGAVAPDAAPLVLPEAAEAGRVIVRVRVSWADLEPVAGSRRPELLDPLLNELLEKGYRVALAIDGSMNPHRADGVFPRAADPADADYQGAFVALVQDVARRFPKLAFFELDAGWFAGAAPSDAAFLLKKTAVQVTGIAPGSKVLLSDIAPSTLEGLKALMAEDVSAYVDAYAVDGAGEGAGAARTSLEKLLEEADPGAEVWVHDLPAEGSGPGMVLRPCLRAMGQGFLVATVALDAARLPDAVGHVTAMQRSLPAALTPVPGGKASVTTPAGAAVPGAGATLFFDAKSLETIVAWYGDAVAPTVVLTLETADVGRPTLSDPLGMKDPQLLDFGKDNDKRKAAAGVPLRPYPLLARFPREVSKDIAFEPVKMDVSGEEDMPVAEIIARNQKFQAEQDERMRHFVADERISLHYEVSAGVTIDVISDNSFYFEKGGLTEWRETAFYVNGVKWRWGQRPKLPLIQPEKVATAPLVITLGKEYDYEKKGRETVEGRDCYVVAFSPRDAARSLYSGRVWIDRATFARVRMSVVQTGLEPPVISNDETQTYRPVETESGTFWLTHRIDGQQIFSIGGSSTPVTRQVDLSGFQVNAADFAQKREAAYASTDIMFRETDGGDRYLDVGEGGARVVNEKTTKSSLLGAAGVFYQPNFDFPLPLLGVNYFNFDLFGTGSQFNTLFAGALATATINKPDLWGKCQLSADVIGIFVPFTDRLHEGESEFPREDVEVLNELATVRLGVPFANFFRFNTAYVLNYYRYDEADDTGEGFILPQDHVDHGLSLGIEYKRAGWRVSLVGEGHQRSSWELWGHPDGRDFDPDDESYTTEELTFAKDFYLPKFMRLHADVNVDVGQQLDRFSKFGFSYFGNHVHGFAGTGVRYDEGAYVRVYYGFNVAEVVRLDVNLDYARVRDRQVFDEDQSFLGTGLTATLMGPWKTIINLDYGYGLTSDIPGLEHESEYRLLILKVFK